MHCDSREPFTIIVYELSFLFLLSLPDSFDEISFVGKIWKKTVSKIAKETQR